MVFDSSHPVRLFRDLSGASTTTKIHKGLSWFGISPKQPSYHDGFLAASLRITCQLKLLPLIETGGIEVLDPLFE